MSDPQNPDEPVFDQVAPRDDFDEEGQSRPVRNTNVTVICIFAFLLAGVGLLTSCGGLAAALFTADLQKTMASMPGQPPQAKEAQAEMNAKAAEITARYRWVTIPLLALKMACELVMIFAAAMTWGMKERGRYLLVRVLLCALAVEAIVLVPGILTQIEMQAVTRDYMGKAMPAQPGAPPQAAKMAESMMMAGAVLGMVFGIGWLVLKGVYYGLGARYLSRPDIAALFQPSTDSGPE